MKFLNKNGIIEALKSNLLASLSLCMILFSANGAAAFQNDGTIKIGLIETLTGGAAPYGVAGARGTIMAFEEANASGGIEINGKKVKISVIGDSELGSDGGLDPALAIATLKKLALDENVLMVKGPTTSTNSEAVFNYLNELSGQGNGLIVHSSSAGAPGLGGSHAFTLSDCVVCHRRSACACGGTFSLARALIFNFAGAVARDCSVTADAIRYAHVIHR